MTGGGGFGVSFLPNGDQRYLRPGQQPGQTSAGAPLQDAIKILSLRVPQVLGANPLTPLALLTAPGGGGMGTDQLLQLMRTLGVSGDGMEAQAPSAAAAMAGGGPSIGGAASPFAVQSRPTGSQEGYLGGNRPPAGGAPMPGGPYIPSMTAGGTAAPGGGLLQTGQEPPASAARWAPPDAEQYWDLARRARESMGRVAY